MGGAAASGSAEAGHRRIAARAPEAVARALVVDRFPELGADRAAMVDRALRRGRRRDGIEPALLSSWLRVLVADRRGFRHRPAAEKTRRRSPRTWPDG